MKTRAAILWERGADWSVEEIDLDPPRSGEVLVRVEGSGLCHSDRGRRRYPAHTILTHQPA